MKYTLQGIDSLRGFTLGKFYQERDFPTINFKNADIDYVARNTTDCVRFVLSHCPLRLARKRIVVDVKVHNLEKGDIPALPFWHMDGTKNPLDGRTPDINHLFVTGVSLTSFLSKDIEVDIEEGPLNLNSVITEQGTQIYPNTIWTYTRQPHKAIGAYTKGTRLLIRVTESDYIVPCNKPFQVTTRRENV